MPAHKTDITATFAQERYARYRVFLQLPPVDAYLRAYEKDATEKKKGDDWRAPRDAQRIEKNKTVQKLMTRFHDEVQIHEGLTPTAFCYRIQSEIEHARDFGAKGLAAIAKHTEMLGKVAGLMVDRHHHTHQQLPDEEAKRQLAYLFTEHKGLRELLEKETGGIDKVLVDALDSQVAEPLPVSLPSPQEPPPPQPYDEQLHPIH